MGGGGVTRKDRKEREGKVDTHGRAQKKSREPRERRLEQELPAGSTTKCLSERAHAHSIAALPRHIALNPETQKGGGKEGGLMDRNINTTYENREQLCLHCYYPPYYFRIFAVLCPQGSL